MWSLKLLIVGSLVTLGFFQFQKNSVAESKINGISLVASGSPLLESAMPHIISISANQAALMPFGFMKSLTDTSIWYDTERQWFGETKEGIMQYTNLLRKNNISVMIKPQIWVSHGEFTGDITMNSEQEWRAFEKQYASFILAYAQIASELDVSMFCIGTELKSVVRERPLF